MSQPRLMRMVCKECGEPVVVSKPQTGGLGTARCRRHPKRFVTVVKDLSGGTERDKGRRKVPVTKMRHTAVRMVPASLPQFDAAAVFHAVKENLETSSPAV